MSRYEKRDHFHQAAKAQGYAARSAFKLEELDDKFHFLTPGARVVDLGAAPGSWMQLAAKRIGAKGYLLGIDLEPLEVPLPPQARFEQADILRLTADDYTAWGASPQTVAVVLCDAAPKMSGIKDADRARSLGLVEMAWSVASLLLRNGGHFIFKIFYSSDFAELQKTLRQHFVRVVSQRPQAVRPGSEERYIVCSGFR